MGDYKRETDVGPLERGSGESKTKEEESEEEMEDEMLQYESVLCRLNTLQCVCVCARVCVPGLLNDLHSFDTATRVWARLNAIAGASPAPCMYEHTRPRTSHAHACVDIHDIHYIHIFPEYMFVCIHTVYAYMCLDAHMPGS